MFEGDAEVLLATETGISINRSPLLLLTIKVWPRLGGEFQTTGTVMATSPDFLRSGNKIKIKFNPRIRSQFVVV